MRFFFPDSQDQIDPSFDLRTEERSIYRVRQRDDRYAHEALAMPPFDGLLVSKTIVDGLPGASGKYTVAQRQRLYRVGIRRFFRLDSLDRAVTTLGDCGAFTYHREHEPPYSPEEVVTFYEECGFDEGISVDHVILGYSAEADERAAHPQLEAWCDRQRITLELAADFLRLCRSRKVDFTPVGVAQGWSPRSYAEAVQQLQKMGYQRIALGGMVPLKTRDILTCLNAIANVRSKRTQLHLLGVTRCDSVPAFGALGVTSFDSTSPFRQAFQDDRDNYYTLDATYTAIRVPQVDGNPRLKGRIAAGEVDQAQAVRLEAACLKALRRYDDRRMSVAAVLRVLREYELLYDDRQDRSESYRQTLEDRPWTQCDCGICAHAAIDVALFRGSERNKRRGFHNLYVFRQRLDRALEGRAA